MRSVILIALGLAAVIAALFLALSGEDEATPSQAQQTEQPKSTPPASATKTAQKKTDNEIPSFDVVRINPNGDVVMAGRATSKAEVTVLDSDTVLGNIKTDDRGEWVFLPTSPLEPGERELSLRSLNPDGSVMTSKDIVVLMVPEKEGETALAVTMSKDGKGPVKALQVPGAQGLDLAIDAVNYDEGGKLSISGTAPEGGVVFLYLDQDFLGNTQADDRGGWTLSPNSAVKPGVYKLRADHVDENRKVLNRVSIPFSRAAEIPNIPDERKIVVQPGNSLWRIARRVYGTGFDYAVIYQANQAQISDPNLIYPGQIFELPKAK
ncbi:LysM peptidoglycan-binding domain-containing protein [Terasakiella sp. SH-1]|uniref:LysM peptidoglycan-binding domain-containing protein n=1 Tax=Terasakiella sp. SH-1 TaxID=2560057 RepID=UPI001073EAD9|nr:LysM peptidoglycan-binding domain-containing protein [Terasakiella sp. SH-1]